MVPQETASGAYTKSGLHNHNFISSSFLHHDYTERGLSLHSRKSLQNIRTLYQHPRGHTAGTHSAVPAWYSISIIPHTDTPRSSYRVKPIFAGCSNFTISNTNDAWTYRRLQLYIPSPCRQTAWRGPQSQESPCLQPS